MGSTNAVNVSLRIYVVAVTDGETNNSLAIN
jgi:hypothetical protein